MIEYLFLFVSIVLSVFVQLSLKKNIVLVTIDKDLKTFLLSFSDRRLFVLIPLVIIGVFSFSASLSRLELNVAYSFTVLNHIMIMYGSYFFLQEEINKSRHLGVVVLCIGVIIFNQNFFG